MADLDVAIRGTAPEGDGFWFAPAVLAPPRWSDEAMSESASDFENLLRQAFAPIEFLLKTRRYRRPDRTSRTPATTATTIPTRIPSRSVNRCCRNARRAYATRGQA